MYTVLYIVYVFYECCVKFGHMIVCVYVLRPEITTLISGSNYITWNISTNTKNGTELYR